MVDFNVIFRKYVPSSWRRPIIIKGLGIVSWIELSFFVMFIALLVWHFSVFLHSFFGEIFIFKPQIGEQV